MGRILQLTPSYVLSLNRLRPPLNRAERLAVAGELRHIETDPLPAPEDFEALLNPPAVGTGMARKVRGYELWVLYRLDEPRVSLRELTARAPVRVDE